MSEKIELLIEATDNASSVLGGIGNTLGNLGRVAGGLALGGIAALGAGVIKFASDGLTLNNSMEKVTAQLNAFTKDGAKTAAIIETVRERAAKTPFEFDQMAKAAVALLPASKTAEGGLNGILEKAEILAASNPAQGLEGAAFALKEAVSGDFTSVIERFNLPRQFINDLKKEGVPNLEIVQRAMKEMGLDVDLVSNLANTAEGRWSTFKDTLANVAKQATKPIFEAMSGGIAQVNTYLEANGPLLNQIGTTIAGVLTQGINGIKNFAAVVGPAITPVIGFFTTLSDSLKIFKDPLDALRQALITTFSPDTWAAINTGIEALKTLRTFIDSLILGFTTFKDPLDAVKQAFLTAFGPEISVPVVSFLASIQTVFSTISGAVTAVLPTLLSFGASIGALFMAELPLAITFFTSAWNTITTVVTTVINAVKAIVLTWGPVIQTALAGITAFLTTHGAEIQLLIGTAWNAITTIIQTAITTVTTIIQTAITTVTTIINALAPVVNEIFGAISTFLNAHGSEILGFLTGAWNSISAIVSGVAAIIQKVVTTAFGAIQTVVTTVFGAVASFIKNHGDEIQTVLTGAWNFIKTIISGALFIVEGLVSSALAFINGDWATGWKTLESVTKASNDIIKSLIDTAMKLIEGVIKLAVDNFKLGWENGWKLIQDATTYAMAYVSDGIDRGIYKAKLAIAEGVNGFIAKFNELKDKMSTIGQQLLEGMVQGIRDKVGWLVDEGIRAANAVLTAIKNTLGVKSPSEETIDVAAYLMKGGAIGVKENAYLWVDEAIKVANDLIYTFDNGLNTVLTNSQIAFERIAQTITPILQLADTADSVMIRIENSAQSMASAVSASMAAASNSISKTASELGQFAQSGGVGGITDNADDWTAAGEKSARDVVERIRVTLAPLPQIIAPTMTQTATTMVNSWSGLNDDLEDQILGAAESIVELAESGDHSSLVFAQAFEVLRQTITGIVPSFDDSKGAIARMHETLAAGKFDVQAYWKIYEEMMHGIGGTTTQAMPVVAQTFSGAIDQIDLKTRWFADSFEDQILTAAESFVELAQTGDHSSLLFAQSFEAIGQKINELVPSFDGGQAAMQAMQAAMAGGQFDVEAYWKAYDQLLQEIKSSMGVSQDVVVSATQTMSNAVVSATQTMQTQASSAAQSIAASMIAAGQVINTTQQQLAGFIQNGGVGGIIGGTYTPSQAFQNLFTNPPPVAVIAPPRPSSVPKGDVVNNTSINITINSDKVDRYAVEDGVMSALRRSGLGGRYA